MSDDRTIDKIVKLLAKAEGTDNEAEADTFMAAAQRLMAQHAIEEAMVRAAGRRAVSEVITETVVSRTRTWFNTDLQLATRIANANDCKAYGVPTRRGPQSIVIVGHAEDVSNAMLAYGSLQVQLARFLRSTPSDTTFRRAFRYGFASRAGDRLDETRAHVVEEAAVSEPSLLPVLADKAAAVNAALPPDLRNARGRCSDGLGFGAGRAAGSRADVGGPAMPTGARAIEAGV
jgi:hypothetical protein